MRPVTFLVVIVLIAFSCIECDYQHKKRREHDQTVIDMAVDRAMNKASWDQPDFKRDLPFEDQLRVIRFGRVSHDKGGKTEEYWEAQVQETKSKVIFNIRCDEKTTKQWDDLVKELEEKNFRWKFIPMSKEAVLKGWGESWSIPKESKEPK